VREAGRRGAAVRIGLMLRTFDEKGGIAVYSRNLVRTLLAVDRANEYEIFYRSPEHLGQFRALHNVVEHVVHARGKALWDQVAIPRACRRRRVDVLFNPKFTVPLLTSVPSVMVVHGADWFLPEAAGYYTRLDRAYMRVFLPMYLHRAAAIISVSKLTTQDFVRLFPYCRDRIATVYFGPAPHFRREVDPARLAAVRAKYRLPDRYILTLQKPDGDTRKNLHGILAAFRRVHAAIPHKLVVGGFGCERFRQDYAIPAEGWGRDVVFPGYLDQADLPAVYTASDLFLYPSNFEAFPIPLTEAMSCGVPIVTSKVNGLAEIAGDAAALVDPHDPAEIADAVRRILTDGAWREELAARGLGRACLFSWENCARRTLEILESVGQGDSPTIRPQAGTACERF
jgi:glycosyltransferase involved in cell wall biosynthesis